MTTQDTIRRWLHTGKRHGATHVIVMVDGFDHTDYPVYVDPGEDPRVVAASKTKEMQRVMECYAPHLDFEAQLTEYRAHHYEMPPKPPEMTTHSGSVIDPNSLYHKLLAKTGKTHEEVQVSLKAEREERRHLAALEVLRPKTVSEKGVAIHLFIEALVELCEKHNLSIALFGGNAAVRELDRGDIGSLRDLDPLTEVAFPTPENPYR